MPKTPVLYCDDGSEIELPCRWEICGGCRGEGKSSAYLGAYTASEMDEAGPEFMDDYMAGHYDRTCDECGGSGKIKVPDRKRISKKDWRAYVEQRRGAAECDAIQRQEWLMEGGWREEGWR